MTLAENPGTSTTGSHPGLPRLQTNENYLRLYCERGFKVFPASPGMKKPAIEGWQGTASSNLDLLLESYSLFGGKFRDNEIATLTGISFIVVDDDGEGLESLMPPTPHYNSQQKGRSHYLVKVPEGLVVRNIPKEKLGIEVDIKGLGGLVILPSGSNNREWVISPDQTEIADCPEWLLERIQAYMESRGKPKAEYNGTKTYSYFTDPITESERNTTLFDRSVSLFRRSFSIEDVGAEVVSLNDNCTPPLPPEEIRYIIESAASYVDVEKVEKIRAVRDEVLRMTWRGHRGRYIRSILIALLTENIDHCTVKGDDVEVSVSYTWLAERTGLSLKSIKGNLKVMKEVGLVGRGHLPYGRQPGTLVVSKECISTPINNPLSYKGLSTKRRLSIGVPLHSSMALLELNSQRVGNLGKAAVLVLEVLMERSHQRKEIEEKFGYKKNGANKILQKLKKKGLIDSDDGLYFLTENFDELLAEEIEFNDRDINEKLVKRHEVLRRDYQIRLESWEMAGKDYQEVLKTAKESGGADLFSVTYNKNNILKRFAYLNYLELKAAQRAKKGPCYNDVEPTQAIDIEEDAPGQEPAETVCPAKPRDLLSTA